MPSGVFKPAGDDDQVKEDAELAKDVNNVSKLTHADAVRDPGGIKRLTDKINANIERGKARDAAREARKGGGGKSKK